MTRDFDRMDKPHEILECHEIEALLVDYCRYLDSMDLDRLSALFAEDCFVVYGPDRHLTARGRAELEMSLARMWRWARTAHHLSNVRIWLDGGCAALAESSVWAWHLAPDGEEALVFGVYHDRLMKADDRWFIRERRMEMRGSSGGFRVPIPQTYRAPPPAGWKPPDGL